MTGVVAGVLGALATRAAVVTLLAQDGYGAEMVLLTAFGGVFATALLHVWMLKLGGQQRRWAVVVPGISFLLVLAAINFVSWGWARTIVSFTAAFAVAGAITGPREEPR